MYGGRGGNWTYLFFSPVWSYLINSHLFNSHIENPWLSLSCWGYQGPGFDRSSLMTTFAPEVVMRLQNGNTYVHMGWGWGGENHKINGCQESGIAGRGADNGPATVHMISVGPITGWKY